MHLEWMDQNNLYAAVVPMKFDRALAISAEYFIENIMHLGNIMYLGKSVSVLAQHAKV